MREYLWKFIAQIKELDFFVATSDLAPADIIQSIKKEKGKGKGRRGKKDAEAEQVPQRPSVKQDVQGLRSLADVVAHYGDTLRIVAVEGKRRFAIMGLHDQTVRLSPVLYSVLALIAKQRTKGITQQDLSKQLNIDPRSLFHYIKNLAEMNFLVKIPMVVNGTFTNLCIHRRFAESNECYKEHAKKNEGKAEGANPTNVTNADLTQAIKALAASDENGDKGGKTGVSVYSELVRHRITALLDGAKNKVMVIQDLMDALKIDTATPSNLERKWFNRTLNSLVKGEYIERVHITKSKNVYGQEVGGVERCVRLLKMYVPSGGVSVGANPPSISSLNYQAKQQAADKDRDVILGEGGVLADLPFEWQVYRLISIAGDNGVTAGTIQRSLNNVGSRLLNKILTRLLKPANAPPGSIGTYRIAEFVGRERRYRYYSAEAFERMMKSREAAEEIGTLEDMGASTVRDAPASTRNTPKSTPSRKKQKKSKDDEEDDVLMDEEEVPSPNRGGRRSRQSRSRDGSVLMDDAALLEPPSAGIIGDEESPLGELDGLDEPSADGSDAFKDPLMGLSMIASDTLNGSPISIGREDGDQTPPSNGGKGKKRKKDDDDEYEEEGSENTSESAKKSIAETYKFLPYNRMSITAVRRRKNLLLLLEEKKILELGHLLIRAYQDLVNKQNKGPATPHTIDKKTLLRTAQAMERDNLLKIYVVKVPMLNGAYASKTLLLHSSLDPQSPDVQHYVELMQDRSMLGMVKYKPIKVELYSELEVERLDDMKRRLATGHGGQPSSSSSSSSMPPPQVLPQTVLEMPGGPGQPAYSMPGVHGYPYRQWPADGSQGGPPHTAGMPIPHSMGATLLPNLAAAGGPSIGAAHMGPHGLPTGMPHHGVPTSLGQMVGMHPPHYVVAATSAGLPPSSMATSFMQGPMPHGAMIGVPYAIPVPGPSMSTTGQHYPTAEQMAQHNAASMPPPPRAQMVIAPPPPSKRLPSSQDPSSEFWWQTIAQQYGWVTAKFSRAKYLHEFLVGKMIQALNRNNDGTVSDGEGSSSGGKHAYKNGGVFSPSMIFRELTFDLYLKIVGITTPSPEVDEFMKTPNYGETRMDDLEARVRMAAFGPKTKFRRAIKQLVDILVSLHILKPLPRLDHEGNIIHEGLGDPAAGLGAIQSDFAPKYRLQRRVPLHDYALPSRPLLRYLTIDTMTDSRQYWAQLEYICSQKDMRKWKAYEEGNEEDQGGDDDVEIIDESGGTSKVKGKKTQKSSASSSDDALAFITVVRNWHCHHPYSAQQRTILEVHVDRKLGTTALNDDIVCRRLAEQTGLSVPRVKAYFKRVEDAHQRKMLMKKQAKQEKQLSAIAQKMKQSNLIKPQTAREKRISRVLAAISSPDQQDQAQSDEASEASERQKSAGRRVRDVLGRTGRKTLRGEDSPIADPVKRKKLVAAVEGAAPFENRDEENIPVVADEELFRTQYEYVHKRNRISWTPEEEETLLLAYAVMYRRAKGVRFMWTPVSKLFVTNARNPEMCRRRINVLMKQPLQQDRINGLISKWDMVYAEGKNQGAFDAQDDVDVLSLDISGMVEYFRTALADVDEHMDPAPLIHLPTDVATLESMFTVKPLQVNSPSEPQDLDEILEEKISLRSKLAVLYSRSLVCNANDVTLLDSPAASPVQTEESREEEISVMSQEERHRQEHEQNLVKAVIKMILMTPEKDYDPTHAFWILNKFPQMTIVNALKEMNDQGTIVKIKGKPDRRVPGRAYQLSDKFLSTIRGSLPNRLIPQAITYVERMEKTIKEQNEGDELTFSPLANNGTMAVLLDLIAGGKISASAKFDENLVSRPISRSDIDDTRLDCEITIKPEVNLQLSRKRKHHDMEDIVVAVSAAASRLESNGEPAAKRMRLSEDDQSGGIGDTVEMDTMEDGGSVIATVLDKVPCDDEEDRSWLRKIFKIIDDRKAAGASMVEIKAALEPNDFMNDTLLRRFVNWLCRIKLQAPEIPIVSRVGFNTHRYVGYTHLENWTVQTDTGMDEKDKDPLTEVLVQEVKTSQQIQRSKAVDFTPARMWYDINGNKVDSVLRAGMETVLSYMVQFPGISESKLHRRLSCVMSRAELEDILELLLQRGACRRKCIMRPKANQLFDSEPDLDNDVYPYEFEQRHFFLDADVDAIDSNKITCYFPNLGWYRKTA
ncbi:hypothetical protein HK102_013216 [Quaeritorhiza haematococci]|nr:hypothetical protein HK102_013216 [Quaeritorhiza haematococci]